MPKTKSNENDSVREVLKDEERSALAATLDEDLETFMKSLASKKKGDADRKPFNFDEWCRELDQHPAFMTDLHIDKNGQYSEPVQALQALKYDDSETESRIEKAQRHKDEGNKHFRYKKYRWATDCYTNGIKELCADRALNSILYSNRAAAQIRIGNLRSASRDCVFARRFDASNMKAVIRCAECLVEMGYGKRCIDWIDTSKALFETLPQDALDKDNRKEEHMNRLEVLRMEAVQMALVEERDTRRAKNVALKEDLAKKRLLAAFKARNLQFEPKIHFDDVSLFEWSQIEVLLPQTKSHVRVFMDDENVLHWPLLVQYPERGQTDFFTECCELNTLEELLHPLFQSASSWDPNHDFRQQNVRLFVTLDSSICELSEVLLSDTLREVLSTQRFVITHGLPVLQMYTKQRVERNFERLHSRIFTLK